MENFKTGDAVFAKIKGYPYWPAKVTDGFAGIKTPPKKIPVLFYGTHEKGFVCYNDILPYEEHKEKITAKTNKKGYKKGLQEIENTVLNAHPQGALRPLAKVNSQMTTRGRSKKGQSAAGLARETGKLAAGQPPVDYGHVRVGEAVFARVTGFPFWPAKVVEGFPGLEIPQNKIPVFFYGTHEKGFVRPKDVVPYLEHKDTHGRPRRDRGFLAGLRQLERAFGYPSPDLPPPPTNLFKTRRPSTPAPEAAYIISKIEEEEEDDGEGGDSGSEPEYVEFDDQEEGEGTPVRKKSRFQLKVKFTATATTPAKEVQESQVKVKQENSFEDVRQKNIAENKALLAKLLGELNSLPEFESLKKKPAQKPPRKNNHLPRFVSRRILPEHVEIRRNPNRQARTEKSLVDAGPELPSDKTDNLMMELPLARKRRSPNVRTVREPPKPVEEITEEDLALVADCSSDKIYDTVHGSTCHQCRQKTCDTKTICRSPECRGTQGQFCGPCLRNRYGEEPRRVLTDPEWICPPCRGICNCSLCRKRNGRYATGILIHTARSSGYDSVQDYLASFQK